MEIESGLDDFGQIRVGAKLTEEDYGTLLALSQSPHWKFYRQLLIKSKEEFMLAVLKCEDPHSVMKQVGFVAGLNFAINQIAVICTNHKKVIEKSSKRGEPQVVED